MKVLLIIFMMSLITSCMTTEKKYCFKEAIQKLESDMHLAVYLVASVGKRENGVVIRGNPYMLVFHVGGVGSESVAIKIENIKMIGADGEVILDSIFALEENPIRAKLNNQLYKAFTADNLNLEYQEYSIKGSMKINNKKYEYNLLLEIDYSEDRSNNILDIISSA